MMHALPRSPGHVFISYRREETAYPAGWLFDRLTEHFGEGSVFKDVDSIEFGDDFDAAITAALASCDVLLALIGDRWVTLTDEHGHRRLDRPDDFVRREIEAALTREVRVIPVLVNGARMPRADQLPSSLTPLVRRQALEISPSHFASDTSQLIKVVKKTLDERHLLPARAAVVGRSPRRWMRAAVGIGAGAVLIAAIVVTFEQRAALQPDTSPASTTSPPARPTAAGSAAPTAIIAADDFSSTANGWTVSAVSAAGGQLLNGLYRLSVDPATGGTAAGAFPQDATNIYPVTPSDVVVEVTGTQLPSSDPQMQYGIMCRANKDPGFGYFLTLSNRYAGIAKSSPDAEYEQLTRRPFPVEAGVAHRLRAECRSTDTGTAVELTLAVDDRPLAEYIDRTNPLTKGCVGLWIGMDATAHRTGEAEFDDFVVRG